MSDQPGIPAITVFPPFNPTSQQPAPAPAPEPVRDQAPVSEPEAAREEAPQPQAPVWDAAAPATPMPWDFEAPTPEEQPAADEPAAMGDEEDDLPWLEVPTAPEAGAAEEIRADEEPNWMEWVRTEEQAPPADEGATPIEELAEDAQPWAPEVETAADPWQQPVDGWKAPEAEGEDEPWSAPAPPVGEDASREPDFHLTEAPAEPEAEFDLPEPELYDLPDVTPSTAAAEAEAEPAWELPAADAHAGSDTPPAWESFGGSGPAATEEPAWAAPEALNEPTPAARPAAAASTGATGAFAEVADRLQAIADALRSDPAAFMAGAQGGGDPLGLLVAGFVLGYNARQGGNS